MSSDHVVVLDGTHAESAPGCLTYRCNNCGVRVVVKLPVSTSEFAAIGEGFVKRHRDCSIAGGGGS